MFRDTNLTAVRYVSILLLLVWWGFHPSCVFLLFFCVRLPRHGKWFSRLCRSRGFVVSSWPCVVPISLFKVIWTSLLGTSVYLPFRHLPAFSLASLSGSALMGSRTWRSRGLPSHHRCIHGRDTGHHCRYGCLFPFWCGSALIFFLCKGSPSVIRQVPVAQLLIPSQIVRQPSGFSS